MKNKVFLFLMLTIVSLLISACKEEEIVEASVQVTTQGFARVGQSTAFVSAYITKGIIPENAMTGFCWSETPSPTVKDSKVEVSSDLTGNSYMLQMTRLSPSTEYYVRAYIHDGGYVYYGNELKFTTKEIPGDGWCVIDDVTDITPTTATALMQIADNGGMEIVEYGVCYKETDTEFAPPAIDEPTIDGKKIVADAGGAAFDAFIENLSQNTNYLVRPYFKTETGVVYGETIWFKTMNFIKTGDVFPGYQSAYLYGEVLMDAGSPTVERGVCWGTTQNPTLEEDAYQKVEKGIGSYYSIVGGLKKGTTYYVRAYAKNADGVFYGLPVEFTTRTGNILPGLTMDQMVLVEAGTFMMGEPKTNEIPSAIDGTTYGKEPVHEVSITKDFYIGKYEITNEQLCVFMNVYQSARTRSAVAKALFNSKRAAWAFDVSGTLPNQVHTPKSGKGRNPVVNITWACAEQYCEWLSAELGVKVRLPSEAEWEYAARGGNKSKGYIYSGSNVQSEVAVFTSSKIGTKPVGSLAPNELGIYDMTGNAFEYCRDAYDANFYMDQVGKITENPYKTNSGDPAIVIRGGSFRHDKYFRVSARGSAKHKGDCGDYSGFRIVMEKLPDNI